MKQVAEATKVEMLQLFFMSSVDGPSFTAVAKGSEHNCVVHFDLCHERDSSSLPDCFPEMAKRTACLGDPVVDLDINVGRPDQ
ncbi:hypothetical protein Pmani_013337 [Petrolisthes manimaculis]|uniref:Uncharacterized protein n=1 Tax=Petrolisthes manimaculis TaxID=1843537 RepID=A0AAE1PV41_9EUCA|nr:hypothetical protein Pmani_013337 [Petrolisthes manimaculis]